MVAAYLFWILLVVVAIAAFLAGGWPEKVIAAAYVAAATASGLLWPALHRYRHLELTVFAVDLTLLAILLRVALSEPRRWLVGAAMLQSLTVLAHVTKLMRPDIWPLAYAWMMQASSFPSLMLLALGIATSRSRQN